MSGLNELDYEQMADALQSLAPLAVRMRKPNDWYVEQRVEVGNGHFLVGEYGNGASPQLAIINHWNKLTNLPAGKHLVTDASFVEKRRHWKWDGWRWVDVTPEFNQEEKT